MLSTLLLEGPHLPLLALLPSVPQHLMGAAPVCAQGSSADQCATNIIGAFAPVVHAIFMLGIWAAIVVAVLVSVWRAPGAIVQIAAGNSRILALYLTGFGVIMLLLVLAFNSWNILFWFASLFQNAEPNWTNPIPFQGTPVPPAG